MYIDGKRCIHLNIMIAITVNRTFEQKLHTILLRYEICNENP